MCKKVSSLCDVILLASIYHLPSVDNHDAVGVGIGRLSCKVVCGRRAVGGGFGDGDARRAAHDTHAFRILRQSAFVLRHIIKGDICIVLPYICIDAFRDKANLIVVDDKAVCRGIYCLRRQVADKSGGSGEVWYCPGRSALGQDDGIVACRLEDIWRTSLQFADLTKHNAVNCAVGHCLAEYLIILCPALCNAFG